MDINKDFNFTIADVICMSETKLYLKQKWPLTTLIVKDDKIYRIERKSKDGGGA